MTPAGTRAPKATARAVWAAAEPFTLWAYFGQRLVPALDVPGLDYFGTYLVVRAAPLGMADPAVAVSCFRSLPAEPIHEHLERAWRMVTPGQVDQLAHRAIAEACEEQFGGGPASASILEVSAVLDVLVEGLDTSGRPLSAANQAVSLPEAPWPRLWRRLNTLREYRGEGHTAALVLSGLDLVETEVLMAAWAGAQIDVLRLKATRAIGEEAWRAARDRLHARGILEAGGAITDVGRRFRRDLEDRTDAAAAHPWAGADPSDVELVWKFCREVSDRLVQAGQMAAVTPVGAPWPPPPPDLSA